MGVKEVVVLGFEGFSPMSMDGDEESIDHISSRQILEAFLSRSGYECNYVPTIDDLNARLQHGVDCAAIDCLDAELAEARIDYTRSAALRNPDKRYFLVHEQGTDPKYIAPNVNNGTLDRKHRTIDLIR